MRKFLVFLAGTSVTFLLMSVAFTATVALTFTPANLKSWLNASDVYDTIVSDIFKQSQDALAEGSGNPEIINQTAVREAAAKAFTPEFLQASTEQFIDGLVPWLEGRVALPTFQISVSDVKTAFAQNIGDFARNHYNSLPPCAPGQLPDTSDILSVPCQVKGISIDAEAQKIVNKVLDSKEFLPEPVLSAQTWTSSEGENKKSVFENISYVPKIYQWSRIAPFVLGVLAIAALAVIIFLSTERRKGMRRASTSLALTGVSLLVSIWLISFGTGRAETAITKPPTNNPGLQNTAVSLIKQIQHSVNLPMAIFGIVFLASAMGLFAYLVVTKDKTPKPENGQDEHKRPEKQEPKPTSEPKLAEPPKQKPKLIQ